MPARVFVNDNPLLFSILSGFARRRDIAFISWTPSGGWVLMTHDGRIRRRGIPEACAVKVHELLGAGEKIRCIAFPPHGGNSWSIVTDKRTVSNNIASECVQKMVEFMTSGSAVIWVAFPPAGGNSWSIITENGFLNKNVPTECHQQMIAFRDAGDPVRVVAFSSRGENSWTLITRRTTFNRNAPPGCHDTMGRLRDLGRPTHNVAFGPKLGDWALISNGHASLPEFLPSTHGFLFENSEAPSRLVERYLPTGTKTRAESIVKSLVNSVLKGVDRVTGSSGQPVEIEIDLSSHLTYCGGMSQAAKDHFLLGLERPSRQSLPTDPDDPLINYLLDRQMHTLGGSKVPWAAEFASRHYNNNTEALFRQSRDEWWRLKELLDTPGSGPVLLGLVYNDAKWLWDNHQVLAYGYEADPDIYGITHVKVYDPNVPREDGRVVTLSLPISSRDVGTFLLWGPDKWGRKVKAFFVMEPSEKKSTPEIFTALPPANLT
jgi:hypothetical protein